MNTNTNTDTNTNLTTAELWNSVLKFINNATIHFLPYGPVEIWTYGDQILTEWQGVELEIANILVMLGFDVVTGYYDPDDERPEEHNEFTTGCYYVALNA